MLARRRMLLERLETRTLLAGLVNSNESSQPLSPFDLNADGNVGPRDLSVLHADLSARGERRLQPGEDSRVDVDGDGLVTLEDLYWHTRRIVDGEKWDAVFPLPSVNEPINTTADQQGDFHTSSSPQGEPSSTPLQAWSTAEIGSTNHFNSMQIESEESGNLVYVGDRGYHSTSEFIPVDTTKTFALQARFRNVGSEIGELRFGLESYDENLQLLSAGPTFLGSATAQPNEAWQIFISGQVTGETNGGSPTSFASGTRFVRLAVQIDAFHSSALRIQIDDVGLKEVIDVTNCNVDSANPLADGLTDDTLALQNCLDQMPNGSTLYFPANRELLVNDQLFIGSHVSLLGQDRNSSGLKLDRSLLTEDDPRFGFWLNFGIQRRYGDLLELPPSEALQLSRGTSYSGQIANLKFTLTENAITTRALLFHSAQDFKVENNFFDGSETTMGISISWMSQQVVGASLGSEGYVSSNIAKNNGVIRNNEFQLRQSAHGGEQIGLGPLADGMLVEGNTMVGAGDDCVGIHQLTNFEIRGNYCSTIDGRIFVGSSTNGIIHGNRIEHVQDPNGLWGSGSFIEITTEGSVKKDISSNIVASSNHLSVGPGAPISFGIRVRGGDEIYLQDNFIESHNGSINAPQSTPDNYVLRDRFFAIRLEHYEDPDVRIPPGEIYVLGNRVRTYGPARAEISQVGLAPELLTVDYNQAEEYSLGSNGVYFGPHNETVVVDSALPTSVAFEGLQAGDALHGVVPLLAGTTGNVRSVSFWVDSSFISQDTSGEDGWTANWDTTQVPNGTYTLSVRAIDIDDQVAVDSVPVTINRPVLLAADNFESGTLSGGEAQWSSGKWTSTGSVLRWSDGVSPGRTSFALRGTGTSIQRSVDTAEYEQVEVAFQSRIWSFEKNDRVAVEVSGDGNDWTTVAEYGNAYDDNKFHERRILLSDAPATLYLRFRVVSGDSVDFWFLDNVEVLGLALRQAEQPPTANDSQYSVSEDDVLYVNAANGVLQGSQPGSDILIAELGDAPSHAASFSLRADGGFDYMPQPDFAGDDFFTFVATTDNRVSAIATAHIEVRPVNDPPTADSQSTTAKPETPTTITVTGRDPDGDALAFQIVRAPAGGVLQGLAPNVVYISNSGVVSDSFAFTVSDGVFTSEEAEVQIQIVPNRPPVADPQQLNVTEDVSRAIQLTGSDPDLDVLAYEIVTAPQLGTLTGDAPNLVFTPLPDIFGNDSFTFRVNDGKATSDLATVSLSILPVDDPPQALPLEIQTREDQNAEVHLLGSDIDTSELSYNIARSPLNGSLSGSADHYIYIPHPNFSGTDSFAYVVSDGNSTSPSAEVKITIQPENDPPTATPQQLATTTDTPIAITLAGNDLDGDPLTFQVTSPPAFGHLSGSAPNLTYTPASGHIGGDTFYFTASDGQATSAPQAVTVTTEAATGPRLAHGIVQAGSESWSTVVLERTYESMVVIATPNYSLDAAPGVPRVRNANGNQFEVSMASAGGDSIGATDIHYIVVEAGVYDEPGFKMEAVKFQSTLTDGKGSWSGEARDYLQSYSNPVVVGQVMSANDDRWSVFWSAGETRSDAPSPSVLTVGKHVGSSATSDLNSEWIGYIVIETSLSGQQSIEGLPYVAAVGEDTVRGLGSDADGTIYNYSAMPNAKTAIATQTGMDGNDGSWALLTGATPLTPQGSTLQVALDEDVEDDSEREHTTEQVAYLIIDPPLLQESVSPDAAQLAPPNYPLAESEWRKSLQDSTPLQHATPEDIAAAFSQEPDAWWLWAPGE